MTHTQPVLGSIRFGPAPLKNAPFTPLDTEQRKYSVLLLYPEYLTKTYGIDTILLWVGAEDIQEAIWKAQLEALEAQLLLVLDPTDFKPLFVAEGYVENQLDSSAWFDEKRLSILRKGEKK